MNQNKKLKVVKDLTEWIISEMSELDMDEQTSGCDPDSLDHRISVGQKNVQELRSIIISLESILTRSKYLRP